MAWRFKASKYKNAAPKASKPEAWIRDLNIGSFNTHGNMIKSSAAFIAFHGDLSGTNLGILPINDSGRKSKHMPMLQAHRDLITDFDFSPFDDGLLATSGEDSTVKLWHIPESGLQNSTADHERSLQCQHKRIEVVQFHPAADFLLSCGAATSISLWDVLYSKEIYYNKTDHEDTLQSVNWKKDGSLLTTSCKDKIVRVFDPRAGKLTHQAKSHQNPKDSKLVWLGDANKILTSGFDSSRLRQINIRDLRNFSNPEKSLSFDSAVGILIPLFDADTNMLFLAGKADTSISYMEVTEKEPFLIEGIKFTGEQTKGACLVPKRTMNVMECEVNRVLQLTSSAIVPISYHVPRKSYRDFHGDLFPETSGTSTSLTAAQWLEGADLQVPKISLDPNRKISKQLVVINSPLNVRQKEIESSQVFSLGHHDDSMNGEMENRSIQRPEPRPRRRSSTSSSENADEGAQPPVPKPRITSKPQNILAPRPYIPPRAGGSAVRPVSISRSVSEDMTVPSEVNGTKVPTREKEETDSDDSTAGKGSHGQKRRLLQSNEATEDQALNTNQRRKMYEHRIHSVQEQTEVTEEEPVPFRRTPSIAERRKMYENRSSSVQDCPRSPQMSRRSRGDPDLQDDAAPTPRRSSFSSRQSASESKVGGGRESKKPAEKGENVTPPSPAPMPKRTNTVFGKVSKYRHLKGTTMHKSTHIENIKNVSNTVPGECDVIYGNPARVALTLSGPGGKIAVFELNKPGKLPDGVTPALVHGTKIMDFAWDPFNTTRLVAGCDDGKIWVWTIPRNGLSEQTNQPDYILTGHTEKIYLVKFHPLAEDVLASASYDLSVRIWDLEQQQDIYELQGHTDQIFSLAWSPCGRYFATACKDGKLRIYDPRHSQFPIKEGKGPAGVRGARVVWALDGQFLVVTGFDRSSERQILVYRSDDISSPLNTTGLDVSPSILVPFYDEDSSTLFVTGKGDTTIFCYEVTEEPPYLCPLSHHKTSGPHQGLTFLPKHACEVQNVEFARALRLTDNIIEPLSFTVPRIKSEYFQDDLFPPTKVTWKPTMTSEEWFQGATNLPKRISLKPENMEALSEISGQSHPSPATEKSPAVGTANVAQGIGAPCLVVDESAKKKQQQLEMAMSSRLQMNMKLEQDEMEGVEESEWETVTESNSSCNSSESVIANHTCSVHYILSKTMLVTLNSLPVPNPLFRPVKILEKDGLALSFILPNPDLYVTKLVAEVVCDNIMPEMKSRVRSELLFHAAYTLASQLFVTLEHSKIKWRRRILAPLLIADLVVAEPIFLWATSFGSFYLGKDWFEPSQLERDVVASVFLAAANHRDAIQSEQGPSLMKVAISRPFIVQYNEDGTACILFRESPLTFAWFRAYFTLMQERFYFDYSYCKLDGSMGRYVVLPPADKFTTWSSYYQGYVNVFNCIQVKSPSQLRTWFHKHFMPSPSMAWLRRHLQEPTPEKIKWITLLEWLEEYAFACMVPETNVAGNDFRLVSLDLLNGIGSTGQLAHIDWNKNEAKFPCQVSNVDLSSAFLIGGRSFRHPPRSFVQITFFNSVRMERRLCEWVLYHRRRLVTYNSACSSEFSAVETDQKIQDIS